MNTRKHNQLQMPTWNWLHINHTALEADISGQYHKKPVITGGESLQIKEAFHVTSIPGLPADLDETLQYAAKHANSALTLTIPEGAELAQPVVIQYSLDEENCALVDAVHIRAQAGSKATIVIRYSSETDAACFHHGFTFLDVSPEADVRLIKAQMLGKQDIHVDATAAEVQQNAYAGVLLTELGSGETIGSCNIRLSGKESKADLDGLYIGDGNKRQDFNYRIEFTGKETEGFITVKGALAGQARKVMKSTVDFVTGCAGAQGREEEMVLALSDRVVNLSAPLLLCGEDNVQGEHATSTGKPDAARLYYLMSRGLDERSAKKLLVEASFTPLLNKIELVELRKEITAMIEEVVHHED